MLGSPISGASASAQTRSLIQAVGLEETQPASAKLIAADHLSNLPNELFAMLVSHLPAQDAWNLGQTSHSIREKMPHELACLSIAKKAGAANSIEKLQSALSRLNELPIDRIPRSLLAKAMVAVGQAFTPILDWQTMPNELRDEPSPAFNKVFDDLISFGQEVGGAEAARMFQAMCNPLPWFGGDQRSTVRCARALFDAISTLPPSMQLAPLQAAARSILRRPQREPAAAIHDLLMTINKLPSQFREQALSEVQKIFSASRLPTFQRAVRIAWTAFRTGESLEEASDNEGSAASLTSFHSSDLGTIEYDQTRKPGLQASAPQDETDVASAPEPVLPAAARRPIAVPVKQLCRFNNHLIPTGEKLNALVEIQKQLLTWNDSDALSSIAERDLAAMVRDLKDTLNDHRETNLSLKLNQVFLNMLASAVAADRSGEMAEKAGRLLRSPDQGTRKIGKEPGFYRALLATPELVPSLKSVVSACENNRIAEVDPSIAKISKQFEKRQQALLKRGETIPTVPNLSPESLHAELSTIGDALYRAADDLIEEDRIYTERQEKWAQMDEINRQKEQQVLESADAQRIISSAMDRARDRENGGINERQASELIRKQLSDQLGVSSYSADQRIDRIVEKQTIKEATATLVRQRAVDRAQQAKEEAARAKRAADDDIKRETQNAQSRAYEQLQQQKGRAIGAALINGLVAGLDNVTANLAGNPVQPIETFSAPANANANAFESIIFPVVPTHDLDTISMTTTASDLDRTARLETLYLESRMVDLNRAAAAHEDRSRVATSEMVGAQYFADDGKPATFYSGS